MKFLSLLLLFLSTFQVQSSITRHRVTCIDHPNGPFGHNAHSTDADSGCKQTTHIDDGKYGPQPGQHHDQTQFLTHYTIVTPPDLLSNLNVIDLGCYRDFGHAMQKYKSGSHETITSCSNWARASNLEYFGLSNGGVCGGTNDLEQAMSHGPSISKGQSACVMPCIADPVNVCGGRASLRLFHNNLEHRAAEVVPNSYFNLSSTNWQSFPSGTSNVVFSVDPLFGSTLTFIYNSTQTYASALLPNVSLTRSYTKSVWINMASAQVSAYPNIMSSPDNLLQGQHYLFVDNGVVSAGHSVSGVTVYVRDNITVPKNVWINYVLTYDHSTFLMTLYRNGTQVSQAVANNTLWIGAPQVAVGAYTLTSYNFIGKIAVPTLWNVSLTPQQVSTLYSPFVVVAPTPPPPPPTLTPTQSGIQYHNGKILYDNTKVYLVWYGDWSYAPNAQALLIKFVTALGGSPWWNILTTYWQNTTSTGLKWVKPQNIQYGGSAQLPSSSRGVNLTDIAVYYAIGDAISSGQIPYSSSAMYMLLTARDIRLTSGFCTSYCGWHTASSYKSLGLLYYGVVGDPITQCQRACGSQGVSPNGDLSSGNMASILAHEIAETISDPTFAAWYDSGVNENADKCSWNFGPTYTAANGAKANMNLAGYDWLIQQNWVNQPPGYCGQKF